MATAFRSSRRRQTSAPPYTTGEPIRVPSKAGNRAASTASPMPPRIWSLIRWPTSIRGSTPRSTGTRPSPSGEYLWDLGFGVAEAMDTAQRGMGLDWNGAKELITRALEAAKARGRTPRSPAASAPITSTPTRTSPSTTSSAPTKSRSRLSRAWAGKVIPHGEPGAGRAPRRSPDDYARVYDRILSR